uniref:Uncharacterized protein n=1 Tax=Neobodo designis TaxID=312471 RepID=A0A7S1LNX9_NEODS|mmetsp:Transcript_25762/g.79464  ORF Transcript_25762/g.79464 Transcript_25762/m.79464 type:complete len:213 (+) Transcript_25762:401-1039(+)|eukprot:CAMPEP_0174852044 /NCGR_PEP_ID=MMETSP1114-20130205/25128_1 /TAXON_ID=312471 /ORGANISM="Neobodo designis, Strain CCAP 1951/1" /LENGTH=212 /DNA_ID=CAMNT_0016086619 /DNA_START=397 /DNA_END=1035 /DNA_ORIENTATION=+
MGCASSTESQDDHGRQRYEVKPAAEHKGTNESRDPPQSATPQKQQPETTERRPSETKTSQPQPAPAERPRRSSRADDDTAKPKEAAPVITIPRHQPQNAAPQSSNAAPAPAPAPPCTSGASSQGPGGDAAAAAGHPTNSTSYLTVSNISTPGEQPADHDPSRKPTGRFVKGDADEPDPVATGEVWTMKGVLGTAMPMSDFVGSTPPEGPIAA